MGMALVGRRDGLASAAGHPLRLRPPGLPHRPYFGDPTAATAAFLSRERRTSRLEPATVYLGFDPDPEMSYFARRHAYAYISQEKSPCHPDPASFVRRVFHTVALDLPQTFELAMPSGYGDVAVRFRTSEDREAAMHRQPFVLNGATVVLMREEDPWAVPARGLLAGRIPGLSDPDENGKVRVSDSGEASAIAASSKPGRRWNQHRAWDCKGSNQP